jgi:hypothetical protein
VIASDCFQNEPNLRAEYIYSGTPHERPPKEAVLKEGWSLIRGSLYIHFSRKQFKGAMKKGLV